MRTVGIICECNPPHAGHFHLISEARRAGDCRVICVMSECFVQRGEAAILTPQSRAELLVRAGADAVVGLPFPYSAAGAEFFGRAGVEILDGLGVTELWFGSERGELSSLVRLSHLAESEEFLCAYRARVASGEGTARAYFELLTMLSDEAEAPSPNDILAISYLRAIRALGSRMEAHAVARVGSGYRAEILSGGEYPSATALRRAWSEGGLDAMLPHLPAWTHALLSREETEGRAPVRMENASRLIVGKLRLTDAETLGACAGLSGGLAGRILRAAGEASELGELLSLAATKTYPDATLRRGILSALLSVKEEDLRAPVPYVRLLAATRAGCAYLASRRRAEGICVVTRQGDIPAGEAAERQRALEARAYALYSLMLPQPTNAHALLCRPPVILDGSEQQS